MAYRNTVRGIGEIALPRKEESFHKVRKSKDGKWEFSTVNFILKTSKTQSTFFSMTAMRSTGDPQPIKTMSTDNKKIEIPFNLRNDEKTIAQVANYKKNVIDFGTRKEFILPWDAVDYLVENLKNVRDRVIVDGEIEVSEYNGKYRTNFNVTNMRLASEDDQNGTVAFIDIYYNRDAVDESTFKEDKQIGFSGFISQYQRDVKAERYFPMQFVLNASKVDFDNKEHVKRFEYVKGFMKTKSKAYVHIPWRVNVFSGAEEVEWSEDMLTDAQKEQIELGLATLNTFRPREAMIGSNQLQFRLSQPILKGAFVEGTVDTEMSQDEFEELIHQATPPKVVESENAYALPDGEEEDGDLF